MGVMGSNGFILCNGVQSENGVPWAIKKNAAGGRLGFSIFQAEPLVKSARFKTDALSISARSSTCATSMMKRALGGWVNQHFWNFRVERLLGP